MKSITRKGLSHTFLYVVTELEANAHTNGFKISFRTYEHRGDFGGFETTLWIKNCSIENALDFAGNVNDWNRAVKKHGAVIGSKKVNNKVSAKFSFNNIKKLI